MKKLLLTFSFLLMILPATVVSGAICSDDSMISYVIQNDDSFTLVTNPVKDGKLQMRFNHISNPNVTVSIINSLGNKVYSKKANVTSKVLNLDISELASGIYFIRVNTISSNLVKKLIIQ